MSAPRTLSLLRPSTLLHFIFTFSFVASFKSMVWLFTHGFRSSFALISQSVWLMVGAFAFFFLQTLLSFSVVQHEGCGMVLFKAWEGRVVGINVFLSPTSYPCK
jgi:hypothetical protein